MAYIPTKDLPPDQQEARRAYVRGKWNSKFAESQNTRRRNRRASKSTWAELRVMNIRAESKRKGIPFNLTAEDIEPPDVCPILLVPLVYGSGKTWHPHRPSVDRLIPELGYTKGNVCVISTLANSMKSSCTDPDVFIRLAEYVKNNRKGVEK